MTIILSMSEPVHQRKYEVVTGFFAHDSQAQEHPIPARFGLLDECPQRWLNLKRKLHELNDSAEPGESFKLFFFCRHGQSYHNVGKEKYGSIEWKRYWGRINGDSEITWGPDSDLTPAGIVQALHIKNQWEKERAFGIPLPDKIYTSPLTRALRTCDIAFGELKNGLTKAPIVVAENLREVNGVYTYDKRGTKEYIETQFPNFYIEESFTEQDKLWVADSRETKVEANNRAKSVLDAIFDEGSSVTFVCCTIHGGLINAFLSVLGHPKRPLATGCVYPVVIRGYRS